MAAGKTPQPPIQLTYSEWTKFCLNDKDADAARRICLTTKDGLSKSRQTDVSAAFIEPEGESGKIFRVTVPLGVQLVYGTRVTIDRISSQRKPYVTCSAKGCLSDYDATAELLGNLKKGRNLVVQAINAKGTSLTWVLPLQDFAAAYNGPATVPSARELERGELDPPKPVLDDTLAPRYRPK
jgi:invasion protein IalB